MQITVFTRDPNKKEPQASHSLAMLTKEVQMNKIIIALGLLTAIKDLFSKDCKIQIIKIIKEITGWPLKESKDWVDQHIYLWPNNNEQGVKIAPVWDSVFVVIPDIEYVQKLWAERAELKAQATDCANTDVKSLKRDLEEAHKRAKTNYEELLDAKDELDDAKIQLVGFKDLQNKYDMLKRVFTATCNEVFGIE